MGSIVNSNRGSAYVGIGAKQPRDWHEAQRDPGQYDNGPQYNVGDEWQNTVTKSIWQLVSLAGTSTSAGALANWVQIGATSGTVTNLTGNSGGLVAPTAGNINVIGDTVGINIVGTPGTSTLTVSLVGGGIAAQSFVTASGTAVPNAAGVINITNGTGISWVAAGNTISAAATGGTGTVTGLFTTFDSHTVTPTAGVIQIAGGTGIVVTGTTGPNTVTISATGITTLTYTNVNTSPYVVLTTDEYLSVDCSSIPITLEFPNAATLSRAWIVKDRTGNAATNNITVTTVGGSVNIDGATSFTINTAYESINIIGNATTYEVY